MTYSSLALKMTVAFVALWAAEEALTGVLMQRYGLAQIVCLRFALHLLLLWALFGRGSASSLWRTRRPWSQLLRASMMVGMPACWALGVQRGLSPATMLSVFWIAPLLILALARVVLKESASLKVWLIAVAASAGIFVLTGPHAMPRPLLLVFPLGMAVCFSAYVIMTRLLHAEPTRVNLFYTGLGACLLLAPLMPSGWVTPSAPDWVLLAGAALLGLGALFALERLTAMAPLTRSAPLMYLQILFAMGFAWAMGHPFVAGVVLAAVLALGALVFFLRRRKPSSLSQLAADTGHAGLD